MFFLDMQVTFAPCDSNGSIKNMPQPTLLMLRPLKLAHSFVAEFTEQTGKKPNVIYAPLFETQAVQMDPIPENTDFVVFSSVNGVQHFAAQSASRTSVALCVGDATADAARRAGFAAYSANGTAADLIALAQSHAKNLSQTLVYACGAVVAHDIDGDLRALGYNAVRRVVYKQNELPLSGDARAALENHTVIPISSPNTARYFVKETQGLDLSRTQFVVISQNAAKPLIAAKDQIFFASKPSRSAMILATAKLL